MPNTSRSEAQGREPCDILLQEDLLVFWDHGDKGWMCHVQRDDAPCNPRTDWDNVATMACFHPRHSLGDRLEQKTPGAFLDHLVRKCYRPEDLYEMLKNGKCKPFLQDLESEDIDICDAEAVLEFFHDNVDENVYGADAIFALLEDRLVAVPMWLYDHSGLTVSCGERAYPYNDKFDSSAVGWCVLEKTKAISELGATEADWKEKSEACIRAEVRSYDQYLQGDVWYYQLRSCHGYCGYAENGADKNGSQISGEGAWTDEESCGGFFGDYILESGIADSAGHGLVAALRAGKYWTGKAEGRQVTVWDYTRYVK